MIKIIIFTDNILQIRLVKHKILYLLNHESRIQIYKKLTNPLRSSK